MMDLQVLRALICIGLLAWLGLSPDTSAAEGERVALVIGNAAYDEDAGTLINPVNDATDMANTLRSMDFTVIEALDADLDGMHAALKSFGEALEDADAGMFFYAGHGMEYAGKNYLLPIDAELDRESDIRLRLIDVDDILWAMETAVPTRLLFLDACRDNPLALQLKNNLPNNRAGRVRQGLTPIDSQAGTFVAFATAPGDVASDGLGRNSPFTEALLGHIDKPGLDADQLLQNVRNEVIEKTQGNQVPYNVSSLRSPFLFNTAAGLSDDEALEDLVWQSIADSDDPDMFLAFLDRFGERSSFANTARARLITTSARAAVGDAGLGPLDLYRSAMDRPIILGCNRGGNSPHFGLGPAPIPERTGLIRGDRATARSATILGGENLERMLSARTDEFSLTLIQASQIGCAGSDRITGDGREGQWKSWHYLVATGGSLQSQERETWTGAMGSFRIESDIVTIQSRLAQADPTRNQCRAFVATNQTNRRVFAGQACGESVPTLDQLAGHFELLEWL